MAPGTGHNTVLVSGTGAVTVVVANPIGATVAISLIKARGR